MVSNNLVLLGLSSPLLEGPEVSSSLESERGDESLDRRAAEGKQTSKHAKESVESARDVRTRRVEERKSGTRRERRERNEKDSRLGVRLSSLLLGNDLPSDNELPDVVLLGKVEELSDLGSPLWWLTENEGTEGREEKKVSSAFAPSLTRPLPSSPSQTQALPNHPARSSLLSILPTQ